MLNFFGRMRTRALMALVRSHNDARLKASPVDVKLIKKVLMIEDDLDLKNCVEICGYTYGDQINLQARVGEDDNYSKLKKFR